MVIPQGARFRRAEGLHVEVSLCRPDLPARVMCRRQEGDREQPVPLPLVELAARLNRWTTAEEANAPHGLLAALSEADLLFWSRQDSPRVLTNAALPRIEGRIGLARNVTVLPLLGLPDGRLSPFPFMARRGWLDQATLMGAVFSAMELGEPVTALRIACCARHGALMRDVVPKLMAGADAEELGRDEEVRRFVSVLNAAGLLAAPEHKVLGEGQVTWLGHAGILYAAGGSRVLVDPLFHPISTPSREMDVPVHPGEVGRIDAVLITHGDNDHLNPQSLYTLPRETPVVIPAVERPLPHQVDLRRVLTLLGFSDIRELAEWERVSFGEVTVVAAPFRGEDWGLPLPARTYLVSSPELTVYASADSTSSEEVYDRLADEFAIDLAFMGVSGAAETYVAPPGFGYGEFYAPWIPRERRNEWVQLCNGPAEAAQAAARLKARRVFGYAAGGASYYALGYADRGSHEDLARLLNGSGPEAFALQVGRPVETGALNPA